MKKNFKIKKLTLSLLAVMLCASMILSFSLSVYAANESTAWIPAGENFDLAAAMCYTIRNSSYEFQSATEPTGDASNIITVSVQLTVYDGEPYEDYASEYNLDESSTMSEAMVNITSGSPAKYASAEHSLIATDGYTYWKNTRLDY